jgi:hypothetical protein
MRYTTQRAPRQRLPPNPEIDGAGVDLSKVFLGMADCFYEAATDVVARQPDEARFS